MEEFKSYLLSRHVTTEKKAEFYLYLNIKKPGPLGQVENRVYSTVNPCSKLIRGPL